MTLLFDLQEFIPLTVKGNDKLVAIKMDDQHRFIQGNDEEVFVCYSVNKDGTLSNSSIKISKSNLEAVTVRGI